MRWPEGAELLQKFFVGAYILQPGLAFRLTEVEGLPCQPGYILGSVLTLISIVEQFLIYKIEEQVNHCGQRSGARHIDKRCLRVGIDALFKERCQSSRG